LSDVNVTLTGLKHGFPDDIAALVVGPQGQSVLLMQGVGGSDPVDANVTFDDAAAVPIANGGPITSGSYQPSTGLAVCPVTNFRSPAPPGPYSTSLSVFNGTDPNGQWRLYVMDTAKLDSGSLKKWSVDIAATANDAVPPTTTIALNPATPDGLNGWYTRPVHVTVKGTDSGGSGVAQTRCVVLAESALPPATFDDIAPGCQFTGTGDTVSTGKRMIVYAASKDAVGNKETPVGAAIALDPRDPSLSCPASPSKLSPANHKLKSVTVNVKATDALSGVAGFTLVSVKSNQADGGLGAGDQTGDIQGWSIGTPDTSGQLRAEKFGGTRTYTLTYRATDLAGNAQKCTTTVKVR
jgi:hypothetical protein